MENINSNNDEQFNGDITAQNINTICRYLHHKILSQISNTKVVFFVYFKKYPQIKEIEKRRQNQAYW
jgi:hypothetical protein